MQMILMVALGVILLVAFILTVLIGGNWLLARFRKPKPPSEEAVRRYRERLLNPCWGDLQGYFGMTIPEPLKELYQRTELITAHDIVFRDQNDREWHVAEFLPADLKSLDETWLEVKKGKNFPFARDSFGDCYYIQLTTKESRSPVMLYHHDGNDVEMVAASLEGFLSSDGRPSAD